MRAWVQVVPTMDEVDSGVGSVLIRFYSLWVWILQRAPREPLLAWRCWTDCLPYWYCGQVPIGLPWSPYLSHCLQSRLHCYSVCCLWSLFIYWSFCMRHCHDFSLISWCSCVMLSYLKSGFVFDFLACLPWDAIYKVHIYTANIETLLENTDTFSRVTGL